MPRIAHIVSTAHYLPDRKVSNEELYQRFVPLGTADEINKFAESTGIRQRFYAPDDWATSDIALPAALEALKRAGRKPEDIDLIIVGTNTPDFITPPTSVVLQHKLGAHNAGTFDLSSACGSFPAALTAASGIMATNAGVKTVLIVGVFMMRKLTDPNDTSIFLYGDGAGAVIMEAGDKPGFIGAALQADGSYAKYWGIFSGGTAEPASAESILGGRTQMRMRERYPREINDIGWPTLFRRLAAENNFTANDVDQIIFTQVRKASIELAAHNCGVPLEKCHMIMEKWGYTGSASIPMALDDAVSLGKIKSGSLVVMIGSGSGYSQVAVAIRMV